MPVSDPIADMLTRIRNANIVYHDTVVMPSSKMKVEMALILKQEGYIRDFEQVTDEKGFKNLKLFMKYMPDRKKVISGLRRISKPGLKVYTTKDELPRVLNGLGIAIISTSSGLMTDRKARESGLGGEVVCYVW
jgi:small subunit ribosomal protein S8